ncbi:MAG TPA: DRTGG domain-containing protein [Thermodesulfobacteriota bacterium]|nr:DRTGG domain-containing protein [Thermodesulfobacteriota bacterium]
MTLQEIKEILDAQVIIAAQDPRMELKMACGCDLMSDVLAFTKEDSLLLTGLTNLQVVRTAEMANIKALVFVRGKEPDRQAIALAMAKNIPILLTELPMYEACGRLYRAGLRGCSEVEEGSGTAHGG